MKKILSLALIAALSFACATAGPRHVATIASGVSLGTFGLIQDTEMKVVCGRAGAPEPPACVTTEIHHAISLKLAEAFKLEADLTDVLVSVPNDKESPKVLELVAKLSTLVNDIIALFPPSQQKTALAAAVAK